MILFRFVMCCVLLLFHAALLCCVHKLFMRATKTEKLNMFGYIDCSIIVAFYRFNACYSVILCYHWNVNNRTQESERFFFFLSCDKFRIFLFHCEYVKPLTYRLFNCWCWWLLINFSCHLVSLTFQLTTIMPKVLKFNSF